MDEFDFTPEAYFDCLAVLSNAPASVTPLSSRELHLFAYLACLLALFEGEPIADWGYEFALTSLGYPHSADFEAARGALVDAGMLAATEGDGFVASPRAMTELEALSSLSNLESRLRWLRAATDCALALPVGSIRYAVTARTDLVAATGSGHPRDLVTDLYVAQIHDERALIEAALGGESPDLLAPAVAWLSLYVLGRRDSIAA